MRSTPATRSYVAFPCKMVVQAGPGYDSRKVAWNEFAKPGPDGHPVSVMIWTTTPWTLPGNRAIAFSASIEYGVYQVVAAPEGNWARVGARYIVADKLAAEIFAGAKVEKFARIGDADVEALAVGNCAHPLKGFGGGYTFDAPLLAAGHVTDDAGTGFVHTAPSHGREDFDVWMASARELAARGIDTRIPYTVDENGAFTEEAPGFTGKRVLTEKGEKGDANDAVIKALIDAHALLARGKLKHQYPHSWRSKKPVIFRNTPQWFIAMDKPIVSGRRPRLGEGRGQRPRLQWPHLARDRQRSHQPNALGAGDRREPHPRHGRRQARLGDEPSARLGRADRGVRQEGRACPPGRRARQRAHRQRFREGGRRRLVRGRRGSAFSRARLRSRRL